MLAELQRIIGPDVVSRAKATWQEYTMKIISQAKLERGARITKAVSELVDDKNGKLHIYWVMEMVCCAYMQKQLLGVAAYVVP